MIKVKRILLSVIFCIFFVAFGQSLGYCRWSYTDPYYVRENSLPLYNSSNVVLTCVDVGHNDTIGNEFYRRNALGKFVYVIVSVQNRQNDAITISNGLFKLVDMETGAQYSVSQEAQLIVDMEKNAPTVPETTIVQLNPNMQMTFMLVFDVPEFLLDKEVGVIGRGGMTGTPIVMKLHGNMKQIMK